MNLILKHVTVFDTSFRTLDSQLDSVTDTIEHQRRKLFMHLGRGAPEYPAQREEFFFDISQMLEEYDELIVRQFLLDTVRQNKTYSPESVTEEE